MARKQGSPVRDKAEWLLQFAVMSLVTPRDFRRLRLEAHRWLDPDGARPLELGELRDVQAHLQRASRRFAGGSRGSTEFRAGTCCLPEPRASTAL